MQEVATSVAAGVKRVEAGPDGGVRLELMGLVRFPAGCQGLRHTHNHWELVHICSGQARLVCAGTTRDCPTDSLYLIRPGDEHQFSAHAAGPLEMLYLGFSFDHAPDFRPPDASRPLPQTAATEWIRGEIRELLPALRHCDRSESLKSFGVRFLPVLARLAGMLQTGAIAGDSRIPGSYDNLIRKVKEMLLADLTNSITVPDMARRFFLSPPYFGEVFKRQTGMSIKEYHRNLRLQRALDLMRRSDRTVSSIAAEVGMDDIAYFSRSFKRRFGLSPRQARKQFLAGAEQLLAGAEP